MARRKKVGGGGGGVEKKKEIKNCLQGGKKQGLELKSKKQVHQELSQQQDNAGDSSTPSAPLSPDSSTPQEGYVTPVSEEVASTSSSEQPNLMEMTPMTPTPLRRRNPTMEEFVQEKTRLAEAALQNPRALRRKARNPGPSPLLKGPLVNRKCRRANSEMRDYFDNINAFIGTSTPLPSGPGRVVSSSNNNININSASSIPTTRSQQFKLSTPSAAATASTSSATPEVTTLPARCRKGAPHSARGIKNITSKYVDKKRETSTEAQESIEEFVPRRSTRLSVARAFPTEVPLPEKMIAKGRGQPAKTKLDKATSAVQKRTSPDHQKSMPAKRRKETEFPPEKTTKLNKKTSVATKTTVGGKKKVSAEPQQTSVESYNSAEGEMNFQNTKTRKRTRYYLGRRAKRSTKR